MNNWGIQRCFPIWTIIWNSKIYVFGAQLLKRSVEHVGWFMGGSDLYQKWLTVFVIGEAEGWISFACGAAVACRVLEEMRPSTEQPPFVVPTLYSNSEGVCIFWAPARSSGVHIHRRNTLKTQGYRRPTKAGRLHRFSPHRQDDPAPVLHKIVTSRSFPRASVCIENKGAKTSSTASLSSRAAPTAQSSTFFRVSGHANHSGGRRQFPRTCILKYN